MAMEKREGIPFEEAKKKIWLKVELCYKDRKEAFKRTKAITKNLVSKAYH